MFAAAALLILHSCKQDQLDLNQEISLSPAVIVPIATLNMNLEDWAGDGIETDSTGALKVVFSDTSIIDPICSG